MNNKRRKMIVDLVAKLAGIRSLVEEIRDEEQDGFDNMPEQLQALDNVQAREYAAGILGDAVGSLEEAIDALEEARS